MKNKSKLMLAVLSIATISCTKPAATTPTPTEATPSACASAVTFQGGSWVPVYHNIVSVGQHFQINDCSANDASATLNDGAGGISNSSTPDAAFGVIYNTAGTYTVSLTAYSASKAKSSTATVVMTAQ